MKAISEKKYNPGVGCKTDKSQEIIVVTMENGEKHVPLSEYSKLVAFPHVTNDGESKTGKGVQSLSFPIWMSCLHNAPCFLCNAENGGKCLCYGTEGNFCRYPALAIYYAETQKAFLEWDDEKLLSTILSQIEKKTVMFRFCVIGDITPKSFRIMCKIAENRKDVDFYTYTKKYQIVNKYIEQNKTLPGNFTVLFSEWEGFPMENPYNLPLSSFVPFGKEKEITITKNDFICPCSSPDWAGTCSECGRCAHAKEGGHVYLYEHSTVRTKTEDTKKQKGQKSLKEIRKNLEKDARDTKKEGGKKHLLALEKLDAFINEHVKKFLLR